MEKIYLRDFDCPPDWCTEEVNFKSYFQRYSDVLSDVGLADMKISDIDIFQNILKKSLSSLELNKLREQTDPSQLTNLSCENLERVQKRNSELVPPTSSNQKANPISEQSIDVLEKVQKRNEPVASTSSNQKANPITEQTIESLKNIRNRLQICTATQKREVLVNHSEMAGRKNLLPMKDYIVSFRVHQPFLHRESRKKPSRCKQEILLLGHQTLSDLKNKIVCISDYQDVSGDISGNPDVTLQKLSKEFYPSSMFYFGNTFYVDKQKSCPMDYSQFVKEWGKERGIKFNGTVEMEKVTVDQLTVRVGYPYVYVHQGCCEHMIIISDARLLSQRDSLYRNDYPLVSMVTKQSALYCMTCSRFPARWIVRENDHLAHDPTYQCKDCFQMFNYNKGKKICNFKAFKFVQRTFV